MAHSPAVTIHRRIGVSARVFTTALVPAAIERPGPQAGRHTLPPPRCPARRMAWWLPGRRCVRRSVPEPGRPAAYSSARLALTSIFPDLAVSGFFGSSDRLVALIVAPGCARSAGVGRGVAGFRGGGCWGRVEGAGQGVWSAGDEPFPGGT